MKITLIQSPHGSGWNRESFPPLGLLSLGASVKRLDNVQVEVIDAYSQGLDPQQTCAKILDKAPALPDVVGVSMTSRNINDACALLHEIRRSMPQATTICGGIHPTLFDNFLLDELDDLDFVLRGEAENSLLELCQRLENGQDVTGIAGLSHRANGTIVRGEPQWIQNLDALPFPDRTLLDYGDYGTQWYGFSLPAFHPMTTAFSSRGCPFKCTFCAGAALYGGRLRTRSAENVFQELQEIYDQGYTTVIYFDDNFVADIPRLRKICELIIASGMKLHLSCAGTLHLLPQDTVELMHRAGFDVIYLGVESGSDAILKEYRKPARVATMKESVRKAKKAHIVNIASFITGQAKETEEDFQASLDFLKQAKPFIADVNPLMVHPGSPLFNDLNAAAPPQNLGQTHSKLVSRYPEQHTSETIKERENRFRKAFQETWKDWRTRVPEMVTLFFTNRTVRRFIMSFLASPKLLRQLIRGATTKR